MIKRPCLTEEEGISLVEMLVAVMLLGIIMAALAQSLTSSMVSVQAQQAQVRATALAQEVLEQAAGLEWKDLGLCEDEAIDLHPSGTYTYASGTEPLVLIPDSSTLCTPLADAPIRAEVTYIRDGIAYDTTTVVSWRDEDGAGSPEDLKHVFVQVDWTTRGQALTTVAETAIAPDALETVLTTEVIHLSPQTYTYINASDGTTKSDVTLRAVAIRPQDAVTVRWRDVDGNHLTEPMTDVNSDGLVWEQLINMGSPEFAVNRLANGETLFEFTASEGATTFEAFDRGLFLLEPDGIDITLNGPSGILVDPEGALCQPVTLSVSIRGFLGSDIVGASWSQGLPAASLVSVPDQDAMSARFEVTYDTATLTPPAVDLTVTGTRVADAQNRTWTFSHDTASATGGIPVTEGCQ